MLVRVNVSYLSDGVAHEVACSSCCLRHLGVDEMGDSGAVSKRWYGEFELARSSNYSSCLGQSRVY